ncbi:uncharacterized protein APUU_80512S [Aspergillus puulaauensis]|uniref:Uncharacterized protein n=1 Tax=Aspergillus puulaauensis TaxID=1220207 RepID=A0A7R7Y140_9EURO|nr:uncharacterized protein APUU_80512S [Aspergillus puulaauensis]BCS30209.1 hypothetical protein APUU_80512S [Aspergillus puulaauensis]
MGCRMYLSPEELIQLRQKQLDEVRQKLSELHRKLEDISAELDKIKRRSGTHAIRVQYSSDRWPSQDRHGPDQEGRMRNSETEGPMPPLLEPDG